MLLTINPGPDPARAVATAPAAAAPADGPRATASRPARARAAAARVARAPVPRGGMSGPARYTVMLVGLGAAGVAIGWLGPRLAASSSALIRRR
ncbi:hypothetical protein ACFY4C_11370 [Actinomadura viridis]|uniref:hypothetical protein n=1 Tax=Actinomadura viridis TaxID=58110 RepID=UPI0036851E94